MVSRNQGRFLAVLVLSVSLSVASMSMYNLLHATNLVDREANYIIVTAFLMLFFWLFFTVVDSMVVLAVPPQRTGPPR